ncbi:hypothetical protein L5F43_07755 [Aliarcobacter butzleri]|uniref:hypothetical protein n=1 Tax=Aliarcobacter butzleri TaxID=28197 RepID=UPI001EDADA18|nr:hypothetical protein [Aliarcobacter butzleri]MCG3706377.1 hypothetical protein [Aliarcobacter butzleri]
MHVVPKSKVVILDSNIPNEDSNYNQFIPGHNYSLNEEVQYGEDIFRSLKDNNTKTPIPLKTSLDWKFLKKANKWAAFDEETSSLTTFETEIIYVVEVRYIDCIALLNLKARKVKFELFNITDDIDTNEPIWSDEQITFSRKPYNYTEYIISEGVFSKTILQDIFPYYGVKLKITISNTPGRIVEIGNIIYGKKIDLGITLTGVALEIGNLLDIDIDKETGLVSQVPILTRKDLTIPVLIDIKDFERVEQKFTELLGIPCLFIAFNSVENVRPSLAIYGFYKTIRIPIAAEKNEYEIQIKGVI